MSLVLALEPLAVLSAHPIQTGAVFDVPYDLARSMIRAGVACKAFTFDLERRPCPITVPSLLSPIALLLQGGPTPKRRILCHYITMLLPRAEAG